VLEVRKVEVARSLAENPVYEPCGTSTLVVAVDGGGVA